jgi:microcystin-dependent protein
MRLKRLRTLMFSLWTAALVWAAPVLAAGTTPLSLVPQFDLSGNLMPGCLLYFFQAGTVATPQNEYTDFGLTNAGPNPLQCDQSGRVPLHWLADGLIHIRLTDSSGTPVLDTTMQVLGPSSGGGGGGGTVDPTTILQTGDEKVRYGTGALAGFVRENGLTIGNAVSGASERANADTQNLFVYLYGQDPNLVVSGGRTGNALNDYNAGKTIALPDMRGRINGFLADMGNSATSVLTSTYANCTVTTLGASCGNQNHTQLVTEMAVHSHGVTDPGHSHSVSANSNATPGAFSSFMQAATQGAGSVATQSAVTNISIQNAGSGLPFTIVPPLMLKTIYIKL